MEINKLLFVASTLTLIVLIPPDVSAAEAEYPRRSGVVEIPPPAVGALEGTAGQRSDETGTGANVNVTQDSRPQVETAIAADPANPDNLVGGVADYRFGDSDAGVAFSFDAGETWSASTLAGINPALGKYDAQGDPAVAAYKDGVFYYSFIDFNRSDDENRLGVAKTTDGGATWPTLGVIIDHSGPGSHDFEDKEYIAVDNTGGTFDGNVYVTWTRFPAAGPNLIMFTRSTDGGLTYSTPLQICDRTGIYQGSVPVVGPNGEIYVAWKAGYQIQIDRSTDGGLSWGSDVTVSNLVFIPSPLPGAAFRTNSFPTMAVDRSGGPTNGNVYVAWADGRGPDILFSRSTDRGVTWSAPIRVSDDTNETYQWFPWMSVGPEGGIDIVFYDRRETPNSTRFHTYFARSIDAGLSFGSNLRITDEVSDAVYDGFGGTFIGDYNGICSTTSGTHPYWSDVRVSNANSEGYTAALSFEPAPDITANGSDGPLLIHRGDPLSIEVALDAGNRLGEEADWWLVADTPFGRYHYDAGSGLWMPGIFAGYQGRLISFGPYEVFRRSYLPIGSYLGYFAVDMVMNGSPDLDQAYIDTIRVDIE